MASDSGWDKGNILPFGGVVPGVKSMAQSVERCPGSCEAFFLLKASERSAYSDGKFSSSGSGVEGTGTGQDIRVTLDRH